MNRSAATTCFIHNVVIFSDGVYQFMAKGTLLSHDALTASSPAGERIRELVDHIQLVVCPPAVYHMASCLMT